MDMAYVLLQFNFHNAALLHNGGRNAAVRLGRSPGGLTEFEGFHVLAAITVFDQPRARIEIDDNAVGLRHQRRRFTVADRPLEYAHALVFECHLVNMRCNPHGVEW